MGKSNCGSEGHNTGTVTTNVETKLMGDKEESNDRVDPLEDFLKHTPPKNNDSILQRGDRAGRIGVDRTIKIMVKRTPEAHLSTADVFVIVVFDVDRG